MNIAYTEAPGRAAELSHSDEEDHYQTWLDNLSPDDVVDAIPDRDAAEYGREIIAMAGQRCANAEESARLQARIFEAAVSLYIACAKDLEP